MDTAEKTQRIYEAGVKRARLIAVKFEFEDAGKPKKAAMIQEEIDELDAVVADLHKPAA